MTSKIAALVLLAAAYLAAQEPSSPGHTLTVEIKGLRSSSGKVGVSLFNSASGFPREGKQAVAQKWAAISGTSATATFSNLDPGVYAVAAMHDENGNGKLDTNLFGIPKEGYGASNNAKGRLGPPSFDAAKFDLTDSSKTVEIQTQY